MAKTKNPTDEVLIKEIYKSINADQELAFDLGGDSWSPSDIVEWIPTSNPILDLIISNRKNGGLPVGRISEISGMESSGKSLLIGHLIVETQKKGGVAVLIDTEQAISREYMTAIGVDLSKLIYISTSLIEEVFESVEKIIEIVRKKSPDILISIFIDSIMGATNKVENAADYDKDGYATQKAIIISKAMRKINQVIGKQRIALIMTNQLRDKMGVMFGEKYATSGGKAIGFHSSIRIRLKQMGKLKKGTDIIGVKTEAKVIKSRVGPGFRTAEFDIFYTHGMDATSTWFETGKKYGAIIPAKKEDENGKLKLVKGYYMVEEYPDKRFQSTNMKELLQDEAFKSNLYDKIAEAIILKYTGDELSADELQYEDSSEDD